MRKRGLYPQGESLFYLVFLIGLLVLLTACRAPSLAPEEPQPAETIASLTQTPTPPLPTLEALPTDIEATSTPPLPSEAVFPAVLSIDWIDEDTAWAVTRDTGRLLRTEDGGHTWSDVTPSGLATGWVFALDRQTAWTREGFPWVNIPESSLYRTRDGGQTWEALRVPQAVERVQFLDAQNGWAVGSEMGCGAGSCFMEIYRTEDGGQTWEQLPVAGPYGYQDGQPGTVRIRTGQGFEFSDKDTISLAGSLWVNQEHGRNAQLWVSRDAGLTWQELRLPMPEAAPGQAIPDLVSHPVYLNAQEAYLTAHYTEAAEDGSPHSYLAFFYTSDGGRSWTARPEVLRIPSFRILIEFVSVNDIFALCLDGLCGSNDGGLTWQVIESDLPFETEENLDLYSLDFVSPAVGWAIVSNQDGGYDLYKTVDGGVSWTSLQTLQE